MKRRRKNKLLKILAFYKKYANLKYITILLSLLFPLFVFTDFLDFLNKDRSELPQGYYFYMPNKASQTVQLESMLASKLADVNNLKLVKVSPIPSKQITNILKDLDHESRINPDTFEFNLYSFLDNARKRVIPIYDRNIVSDKAKSKTSYAKNKEFLKWLSTVKNYRTKFDRITPYDDIIKKYSKMYGVDWRLIAAQMFIESSYKPKSKSYAGAMGLMQITPAAMKQLGLKDPFHIEENIRNGIKFYKSLFDSFRYAKNENRVSLALASYNAGIGHVRDAQRLARFYGLNPQIWQGNIEEMFKDLGDGELTEHVRYGSVTPNETVNYVNNIMARYGSYKSLVFNE